MPNKEKQKEYEKAAGEGRKMTDLNPVPDTSPIPLWKIAAIIIGFLSFFALVLYIAIPGIFGG